MALAPIFQKVKTLAIMLLVYKSVHNQFLIRIVLEWSQINNFQSVLES